MPQGATSRHVEVQLRPARLAERDWLEQIQREASLALDAYRDALIAHPEAIFLPEGQIANGDVIVAESSAGPIGFAAVVASELDGLFVAPRFWGQGIGRLLVGAAVHLARQRGETLRVIANPSTRRFYEKCGFRTEGEVQTRFGPALRMSR